MEIKVEKKPYDDRLMFSKTKLTLPDNEIVCLIGCNGIGKTTLINHIVNHLKKNDYTNKITTRVDEAFTSIFSDGQTDANKYYIHFNKSADNSYSEQDFIYNTLTCNFSSTGESVMQRYGRILQKLGSVIRSCPNSELVVMIDDVDAGTSIDNIAQVVEVLNIVENDLKNSNIKYNIILTANSYELCRNYHCISAYDFKDYNFKTYESYKKYVLKSADFKNKHLE